MSKILLFSVFYVVMFTLSEAIPTHRDSSEEIGGYQKYGGYQAYGVYRGGEQQGGTYQGDDYEDGDEYQSRRGYGGRGRYGNRGAAQGRGRSAGRTQQDDDSGDVTSEDFQYVPKSCKRCGINNIGNGYSNRNKVYTYD